MSLTTSLPCVEPISVNAPNVVNGENYAIAIGAVGGLIVALVYVTLFRIADKLYQHKHRNSIATNEIVSPVANRRYDTREAMHRHAVVQSEDTQKRPHVRVRYNNTWDDTQRYPLPLPPSPPPTPSAQEWEDCAPRQYTRGGMGVVEEHSPTPVAPPR